MCGRQSNHRWKLSCGSILVNDPSYYLLECSLILQLVSSHPFVAEAINLVFFFFQSYAFFDLQRCSPWVPRLALFNG
jgi:hypothetical protein